MVMDFGQIVTLGKRQQDGASPGVDMFNKTLTAAAVSRQRGEALTKPRAGAIKPPMQTVFAITGICIIG
jgi:hypothetical protein